MQPPKKITTTFESQTTKKFTPIHAFASFPPDSADNRIGNVFEWAV